MWAVPAQGVRVMGGSRSSRSHDTRHGYAATEEILIAIQTFHVNAKTACNKRHQYPRRNQIRQISIASPSPGVVHSELFNDVPHPAELWKITNSHIAIPGGSDPTPAVARDLIVLARRRVRLQPARWARQSKISLHA